MHRYIPRYLAILILLSPACKRDRTGDTTEGKIRFSISYEENTAGGYSASVMPREMIMEFSQQKVRNTIEGGLGFFSLVHVTNLRSGQHTTWVKFIDKRYIYQGDRKQPPCCFGMLDGMQIEFTDRSKEIAGLGCRHATARFPDDGIEPFDIWYTEDIGPVNPNSNTPFSGIKGILLEFNTLMGNENMHMVATDFEAVHIPQKRFEIPKNYKPVSKTEIESILNALMN